MIPFILGAVFVFRFDALYGEIIQAHPPGIAGGAAALAAQRLQTALASLLIYGAVILSFLGGVRWGVEIGRHPDHPRGLILVLSVFGALAGWGFALFGLMVQADMRLFISFALLFALHLVWDLGTADLPSWFKPLRVLATLAAMGAIAVGGLANPLIHRAVETLAQHFLPVDCFQICMPC